MDWKDDERAEMIAMHERGCGPLQVATRAVELAAARGGMMTAAGIDDVVRVIAHAGAPLLAESLREHISTLGARVAVLEQEKANLKEGNRLLAERLSAAEESNRELVRRAQQAEGLVESLRRIIKEDRLVLTNVTAERDELKARCATLSAAGEVLGAHVDCKTGEPVDRAPGSQFDDYGRMRYPCSPTCTHEDAAKPGHPERVKDRSEAFKAAVDKNLPEIRESEQYQAGAEAMRAACWEAVSDLLQEWGWAETDKACDHIKAAIEGAVP